MRKPLFTLAIIALLQVAVAAQAQPPQRFRFGPGSNESACIQTDGNCLVTVYPNGTVVFSGAVKSAVAGTLQTVIWDAGSTTTSTPFAVEYVDSAAATRVAGAHVELKLTPGATASAAKSAAEAHVEIPSTVTGNFTGIVRGLFVGADHYGTGTLTELQGIYNFAGNNSTGNITTFQASQNWAYNGSSGAVTTMNASANFAQTGGTGTITTLRAGRNVVSQASDSTIASAYGVTGDIQVSGNGSAVSGITNAYAVWSNVQHFSANVNRTIGSAYNYFAQMQSLGSVVTNAYGYYVSDLSSGDPPTNRYSFWNNDSGAPAVNRSYSVNGGVVSPLVTVTTDTTAGAVTYTAAQLTGGIILRDPNGAGRSDVTPTAANIVAAIKAAQVGQAFEFTIRNTADAAETITITAGGGVTLSGTMTIAQNNSKRFLCVFTNVGSGTEAVTIYSLGTVVH